MYENEYKNIANHQNQHDVSQFIATKQKSGEIKKCANIRIVKCGRIYFRPDCIQSSFIAKFTPVNEINSEHAYILNGCPPNCNFYISPTRLKMIRTKKFILVATIKSLSLFKYIAEYFKNLHYSIQIMIITFLFVIILSCILKVPIKWLLTIYLINGLK